MPDDNIGCFRPFQLVSLHDMIRFCAGTLHIDLDDLRLAHETLFLDLERSGHRLIASNQHVEVTEKAIERLKPYCDKFKLRRTEERILGIEVRIQNARATLTVNWLWSQTVELGSAIATDLAENLFLYIPKSHSSYYNRDDPFGIAGKFPKADLEIKLAGNCLATENYSACVFHLMRAVEIGAKAMVRSMGAQKYLYNTKLHGKPVLKPVELCDWKTLFDGLEKALNVLDENVGSNLRKKETFEYYHHAVYAFKNFRHAWRNKVSHGRHLYTFREAQNIMEFSEQFMTHLAERLGKRK